MFLQIYDRNVMQVGVVDAYSSLIWTKRYNKPGDFEVEIPLKGKISEFLALDNFVTLSEDFESGYYMIIETIEVRQEESGGNTLFIKGRSLESLLERRIVWDKMAYSSKQTEYIIKDLIEKSFINPSVTDRKVENFVYTDPAEDLTFPTVDAEFDGEDLLEVAQTLCAENYHSISEMN